MILILIYWLILFGFFFFISERIRVLKDSEYKFSLAFLTVYGALSLVFTLTSLFGGIPQFLDYIIVAFGLVGVGLFLKNNHFQFDKSKLIEVVFISILFLGWSSYYPRLPDEGLYYNQAVSWFQEYGLVKGLGNFDLFLSQGSAFHMLCAVFNLDSLIYSNDFSGFFGLLFVIETLLLKNSNKWFKLLILLLSPVLLLLSTSESPDLILIVGVVVYTYSWLTRNLKSYHALILLGLVLTKMNMLVFAGFFGIIHWIELKNWKYGAIVLAGFSLHFIKSYWLTGYLAAPFSMLFQLDAAHQIPQAAIEYSKISGVRIGYNTTFEAVSNWTFIDRISHLTDLGILELASLVLIILLSIYLLVKQKLEVSNKLFVLGQIIFLLVWLYLSPQVRLLLPMLMGFLVFLIYRSPVNGKSRVLNYISYGVYALLFIITFIPLGHLNFISENKTLATFEGVSAKFLVTPPPKEFPYEFDEEEVNGVAYYKPAERAYCYDGPFPCQGSMLRTYNSDSVFMPEMLGESLKDGFTYKSISRTEFDTMLLDKYNAYTINDWH